MTDAQDRDREAVERFNELTEEFVEEYGAGRLYWLLSTSMKQINSTVKNQQSPDFSSDSSDFRIDDDLL